jgi:hypothetical protein
MNTEIKIDLKVAMEQFQKRKAKNAKKKRIDNSSLPVGAPMYFYCRFCGDQTDCLPEGYTCRPKRICDPCEVLHLHGLIT